MSKFIIQVNGSAYGSLSSYHALRFTQAAIATGHQIVRVFFYQDGVLNTGSLNCPASDELDIHQAWKTLADQHQIDLVNCVSAALRRGIISQTDANENSKSHWNVEPPFSMGGLGELVTGIEEADRLVSF